MLRARYRKVRATKREGETLVQQKGASMRRTGYKLSHDEDIPLVLAMVELDVSRATAPEPL